MSWGLDADLGIFCVMQDCEAFCNVFLFEVD